MGESTGYIYAIIAAALFGLSSTVNKLALQDLHPLVVSGLIYFCAGILLSAIRYLPFSKRLCTKLQISVVGKALARRDWFYLLAVALCGAVIGPFLYLHGLGISTAVNASLLLNTEVLFTVMLAFVFLRERPDRKDYLALALLFLSAVAITTNLDLSGLDLTSKLAGNLFIIAGTFFWGLDNTISKKLSMDCDTLKVASLKSLIGGSAVLALAVMLRIPIALSWTQLSYVVSVGFFSIGLSLVFFLTALRLIGSMKTVAIFSTASLFGALSAFAILREPVSLVQVAAGLVMMGAVYLMARQAKEQQTVSG